MQKCALIETGYCLQLNFTVSHLRCFSAQMLFFIACTSQTFIKGGQKSILYIFKDSGTLSHPDSAIPFKWIEPDYNNLGQNSHQDIGDIKLRPKIEAIMEAKDLQLFKPKS